MDPTPDTHAARPITRLWGVIVRIGRPGTPSPATSSGPDPRGSLLRRLAASAGAAAVLTSCFGAEAVSTVGADGRAVTRINVELDVGRVDDLFGEPETGQTVRGLGDELEASASDLHLALERLYRRDPALADRFRAETSFTDGVFRSTTTVVTDRVDQLASLLDGMLGTAPLDLGEILGTEVDEVDTVATEFGGGTGIFESVTATLDTEFRFEATFPGGGGAGQNIEFEFDRFDGFRPRVTVAITAPGPILATNGDRDGWTVRWEIEPERRDPLFLRSGIDPDAVVDDIHDLVVPAVPSGSDRSAATAPVVLAVVAGLLVAGAGLAFLRLRHRTPASRRSTSDG